LAEFFRHNKEIARHRRLCNNNRWQLNPDHYLELIQQRPFAFDSARPIRSWREAWPEEMETLLARFIEAQGESRGIKDFIQVLMLFRYFSSTEVIEACHHNYKTRFVTGYALANELIEAFDDHQLSRILSRYSRYALLILDELGYVSFTKKGAELLFQVLTERNERGSIIITSNLGFADWSKIFGEATITAALLDRLTHKAYIIECNWESYRLRQSLKNQRK